MPPKAPPKSKLLQANDENELLEEDGKRLSVERIYQKKSQLEHILLRPDTYIGSVEKVQEVMWVYDEETGMTQREITYVPGLYKIFDEILVNAADNKVRDPSMNIIRVDIDVENNEIKIFNNGKGIPVVMHKDEEMYVPSLIFGHLLTSSNYNDEEEKVTGGRNGYGAKLCNIFSTKFVLETASSDEKKTFKQIWTKNMGTASEPKIKAHTGKDFTQITFNPDLPKFKMDSLDRDTVALLSRRAFDIAASTRGVKVYLNGKLLPINSFIDYVEFCLKGRQDESGNQLKCVHEAVNDRWEIALAPSGKGFQQISFVNSIATTKGGRHVEYVTEMISKHLQEHIKKKNKTGAEVKPHAIKSQMWVFVNCLIVNPTFDSQTKENMTLQVKSFGSTCKPSDSFFNAVVKSAIIGQVMLWAQFKAQTEMNKQCSAKKTVKLKGIAKLEDANDAGTTKSLDCTLILTEGDSAKSLAVSGLGVVGRDKYGVFPLKGKVLNVRDAAHSKIVNNTEINNIIKILGLQYKKKYETKEDLKSLRYGRLMIMTDQDQDGSHIKGLLINFLHHNWPSLLRLPFLEEFITPIVKATKGNSSLSFYSLPEFEEWKSQTENWPSYRIKYYKGLGTSTSQEAKSYFSDMQRHRIIFKHDGESDDEAILMAFSKKHIEQRKEWLTAWMDECKRRRELGLPEQFLYEKDTKNVSYRDFVDKELILFSNMDNERSIPSLVDGFKPGQRKVLFTCIKRNDKKEIKVAQLAGSVAEHSAYHHGEASLMGTIIGLAQNFVGSNNINLLIPSGQFGTRLQGGKDAASPRYIFTQMSKVTRLIFHPHDDPLLNHLNDDNQRIEPEWYIPIIPMILVNGADGIGTGWMTKIPNYNPRDIVNNIKRMLDGEEPVPMIPWFKGFKGTIQEIDRQHYLVSGEVSVLSDHEIEISELPIRVWTQSYKEKEMESFLNDSEKKPAFIEDYKEYHTDTTVRFVVSMAEANLAKAESENLHRRFKLQTSIPITSMVLYDSVGCLKMYASVEEILREFFTLRLSFYGKRKDYLSGVLQAESKRLTNQARFICEKCDGSLIVENKKTKDLVEELRSRNYDPDPVRVWKKQQAKQSGVEEDVEHEEDDNGASSPVKIGDYDYLLDMPMRSLTLEKKEELLRKRDVKMAEYTILCGKTPSDLWREDLDCFLAQLQETEDAEAEEMKKGVTKPSLAIKGRKKMLAPAPEVMPSPNGRRIAPIVDPETRKKMAAAKERKVRLKIEKPTSEGAESDDDLEVLELSDPVKEVRKGKKAAKKSDGMKQTKLNFAVNKSEEESSEEVEFEPSTLRETMTRRAASKAPKISNCNQDEGDSNGDFVVSESDDDFETRKRKPASKKKTAKPVDSNDDVYNLDSEDETIAVPAKPPKVTKGKAVKAQARAPKPKKAAAAPKSKPAATAKPKKVATPKKRNSFDDDDDDFVGKVEVGAKRETAGRASKIMKLNFSDSDDSDLM